MTAPRPMRADARRNYERILATAREAFTEHGPDAPLDDIARRAGVGPGTLYRHFPCRAALVEAVYCDDLRTVSTRAHELLAELPPDEALAEWMRELVGYVIRKRGLLATLRATVDLRSESFTSCKKLMNEAAAVLLEAGQAAGTVRADVTPHDLLLLGHGVAAGTETTPGRETIDRLLAVTLDGLRTTRT